MLAKSRHWGAGIVGAEEVAWKLTGDELHRRLIKLGHVIPTILATAYPDEVVRDQVLKDGVICYLSKPVDDEDLERCLRSALSPGKSFEENS